MPNTSKLMNLPAAVLVILLCFAPLELRAQDSTRDQFEVIRFAESPKVLEEEVTFLSKRPQIDGILDEDLTALPTREFSQVIKCKTDSLVPASYRLAYGTGFFYVYVEAGADKLIFRDRAYQHGDGFHMVLAVPRPNNDPTDEFYVLACSAVDNPGMEWSRHIFWYYNVDDIFIPTSRDTKMEFQEGGGKVSFELLLPWKDVHPYHPWISEGIGFNLCFVKAVEKGDKIIYMVVDDDRIGAENSPRLYARLNFQVPQVEGEPQTFVLTERGNIAWGDTLHATAVTVSAASYREDLVANIKSGEGKWVDFNRTQYDCEKGITRKEFRLDSFRLPPGGYTVKWFSVKNDSEGETGLTILPDFDLTTLESRIEECKEKVAKGSYLTLRFLAQEISEKLALVKPYETCVEERFELITLQEYLNRAHNGEDLLANKTGFVRRAYLSRVDNTFQPYCVWIPGDFDPESSYPLLVFLHGSASDETNIMAFQFLLPDSLIALGPKGRGPSNAFCADHAQEDIAEAIEAVLESYPIDKNNIILSGFSMGGYGVLRTFYETPEKFKALVILSGHPDIGDAYSGDESQPNFSRKEYLKPFKGVPIFIYHGEEDQNLPIEPTKDLVKKLKKAGARVVFHAEPGKGHQAPGKEAIAEYHRWLDQVLEKPR
jgi:predicted esterase